MHTRLFRILAVAGIMLAAVPCRMRAQQAESAAGVPKTDTLAVPEGKSAAERLKAKVDSLRQALEDSPARRRQAVERQIRTADSLRLAYDFPAAVDLLRSAASAADSSQARIVEEALLNGHAGLRMMTGVSQVRVTARERFSKDDFYSMFPSVTDGEEHRFHAASPDGLSLYFSSKERPGAGGYDLYVSRRDRRSGGWSDPVNMGFPYSSPYDDLLYADTGDGQHSVLVSTRDCPQDSVYIYVLAYDPVPPKRSVSSARELRAVAGLEPARRPGPVRRSRTSVDMSAYTSRTAAVRALRDSLTAFSRELDALRAGLSDILEEERESYVASILRKEEGLEGLKSRLEAATKEVQRIEQSFLAGEGTPGQALAQAPGQAPGDTPSALLDIVTKEGRDILEMEESGIRTRILPEGTFSDYVVFPQAPSYTVIAVIPEEETVPLLAQTVIRLHTGRIPAVSKQDKSTVYTAGPFNDRTRAESLMFALRATGVADISISED